MELVDAPQMAPGVCALSNQGGTLIDTRREIAQIGRGYLHPDVVREAAAVLGLVDKAEYERELAELARNGERVAELEAQLAEVSEQYNNLRGALAELMQHGVTVDRRGTIRYRAVKPGERQLKDD